VIAVIDIAVIDVVFDDRSEQADRRRIQGEVAGSIPA
jgi:hypothetical protein